MDFNLYGWGRTKGFISKISEPKNLKELTKISKNTKLIARGYGRSYGDSSIQNKLTVITKNLKDLLGRTKFSVSSIGDFSLKGLEGDWELFTVENFQ